MKCITRKVRKLYDVYIYSQGMKITMLSEVSRYEAQKFCEENQWCFKDENDFVWEMDYEEI